jgi:hypothetical protein
MGGVGNRVACHACKGACKDDPLDIRDIPCGFCALAPLRNNIVDSMKGGAFSTYSYVESKK